MTVACARKTWEVLSIEQMLVREVRIRLAQSGGAVFRYLFGSLVRALGSGPSAHSLPSRSEHRPIVRSGNYPASALSGIGFFVARSAVVGVLRFGDAGLHLDLVFDRSFFERR